MKADFDGGYYLINEPLVRGGIHRHTAAYPNALTDDQLEAINVVQDTAWEINEYILDVMVAAYESNSHVEGLPSLDDEPLPPKMSEEEWENLSDVERRDYKYQLSKIHERNAQMQCKRESLGRKLDIALELVGQPIWFPHFFDFRTRMYPLPQDLNPQGDQICKALLQFHEPKRLGAAGLKWLGVTLANTFGNDKVPFEHREMWAHMNHDMIVDSALDPLDGHRFWMEADEPWTFLAACKEWAEAYSMTNPEDYMSHLPCAMDGVTNGLQHLSLIGRDAVGAVKTNCSDDEHRYDLYTEVANRAAEIVNEDAIKGDERAQAWAGQITRKTVKRAVMTTPYGVTDRGIQDQLIADGHLEGLSGDKLANAKYMKDVIKKALKSTVAAASVIMGYFQDVAHALAEYNVPLRWKTSAGAEIVQSYWNLRRKKVRTLIGEFVLWSEDPEMGLKPSKCALSASPNIIHSQDAAMLQLTVLRLHREYGIDAFAMIHDSYGVHHADVDKMHKVLREVAHEMYNKNWLEEFHQYVLSYAPEGLELPTPPDLGDFDVDRLLNAPYFFS